MCVCVSISVFLSLSLLLIACSPRGGCYQRAVQLLLETGGEFRTPPHPCPLPYSRAFSRALGSIWQLASVGMWSEVGASNWYGYLYFRETPSGRLRLPLWEGIRTHTLLRSFQLPGNVDDSEAWRLVLGVRRE